MKAFSWYGFVKILCWKIATETCDHTFQSMLECYVIWDTYVNMCFSSCSLTSRTNGTSWGLAKINIPCYKASASQAYWHCSCLHLWCALLCGGGWTFCHSGLLSSCYVTQILPLDLLNHLLCPINTTLQSSVRKKSKRKKVWCVETYLFLTYCTQVWATWPSYKASCLWCSSQKSLDIQSFLLSQNKIQSIGLLRPVYVSIWNKIMWITDWATLSLLLA